MKETEHTFTDRDRKRIEREQERLQIVALGAQGKSAPAIAKQLGVSAPTARKWIRQYQREGLAGLQDSHRSGRPKRTPPQIEQEVIRLPLETRPPPDKGERWSVRLLSEALEISPATVSEIWARSGVEPPLHRSQVEHHAFRRGAPTRPVPLSLEMTVPAAMKLLLQMQAEIGRVPLGEYLEERLLVGIIGQGPTMEKSDPWVEIVEQAVEWIQDPENLKKWQEAVPVEDPWDPEYKRRISERIKDAR